MDKPFDDAFAIGFDCANNGDQACLTVIRQAGDSVEIVNVILGQEAIDLYLKLNPDTKLA